MSQIQPTCSNLCMTIFLDSFLFFPFCLAYRSTHGNMVVICKHVSLQKKIHMIYINAYQIPQRKTAFLIYTFRTNDISKNICSATFHRQVPCLQEMGRIERLQCQNQKALALSRYELVWNAIYFRTICTIQLADIEGCLLDNQSLTNIIIVGNENSQFSSNNLY